MSARWLMTAAEQGLTYISIGKRKVHDSFPVGIESSTAIVPMAISLNRRSSPMFFPDENSTGRNFRAGRFGSPLYHS